MNVRTRARERPSRFRFSTREVGFYVDGDRCAGTLYRPDRPRDPPLVVWGASVPVTHRGGIASVAEALAERGYAVYCFDPRGVGASEGRPRNAVAPKRHAEDWSRAVRRARDCDGVDANQVVLAGHGFAGGHAIAAASAERRVRGVLAVAPVLNGRTFVRNRPLTAAARGLSAGVADRVGSLAGRERTVPAAGTGDDGALVAAPAAAAAVRSLLRPGETIPDVPARTFLSLLRHTPGDGVGDLRAPVCFVAGEDDAVVSADAVSAAATAADEGTFVRLPVDHFDLLRGRTRRALADHAAAFLRAAVDADR